MSTVEKEAWMEDNNVSILLLTQNVGAIEAVGSTVSLETQTKTEEWLKACGHFINESKPEGKPSPDVVVLNLQEVGGKKFNSAFNDYFSRVIVDAYPEAGWCSGLLMPREECDSTFTAMATVIFVSKRVAPIASLLSVRHRIYVPLSDDPHATTGSSEYLFHGAKFSNAEKSRKGFLLTSLRVGSQVLNFVNVHLFHDADNSVAVSVSPSPYVQRRRDALCEAITEITPLISKTDALFIFGDFNLRLDGHRLVNHFETKFETSVTLGKKDVKAPQEVWDYVNKCENHLDQFKKFDSEGVDALDAVAQSTGVELAEFERNFRMTYPYAVPVNPSEEPSPSKRMYNVARLPAWCDRVFFNPSALAAISRKKASPANAQREQVPLPPKEATYTSVHLSDMDHDAVYLAASIDL